MKDSKIYLGIILAIAASCSNNTVEYAPADIKDLHTPLAQFADLDSLSRVELLDSLSPELTAFFKVIAPEETLTDGLAKAWANSRQVATFTPPTDSVFPTEDAIRKVLGYILGASRERGLNFPERRYATVVYGRQEAIMFVDSVMLIALNHFLGPEYEGYSPWPVYRRLEKDPAKLPYYMAEALLGSSYPYSAEGEKATLLSQMLYHGALAYSKLQVVPHAKEALALDYNDEDFSWIEGNRSKLWSELASSGLLFDTSETLSARFVSPAPAVRELPTMFPGRIGRYVGLKLVEEYIHKHKDTELSFLLSPDFYTSSDILAETGAEAFR